jgi:hypothetical protein
MLQVVPVAVSSQINTKAQIILGHFGTILPLKMGTTDCPEASVINYQHSSHNNPEDRSHSQYKPDITHNNISHRPIRDYSIYRDKINCW